MNLGKPIFILFAVLAFLSALWRGLPPFGLIETLLWGSLAWLWAKKDWKDVRLNYALLAVASLILLGEGYRVGVVAGQQQTAKAALKDPSYKVNANPLDALRTEPIDKCGPSNTNLIDRAMDHCDDTPKLAPEKKPESTNNPSSFEDSVAASEKEQISAIVALTPDKLIVRCGPPLTDRTRKFADNTKARALSYTDVYGSTTTLVFSGPHDIYLQHNDENLMDPIIQFRLDPPVYAEKYALRAAYMLPCAAKP
ncbi:MAG: hypothetical protein ABSG77_10200 [Candidatus Acidiferrum sp.]|jgi:hypothetical protein